ncbi:MAG TPA: hypothetical protein VFT56_16175 [Sphingomonas sp.]|nr:hypothetical protein [Sphingomonas sp.]
MSDGVCRFRVLPNHLNDALRLFREAGFEPHSVTKREDGNTAIEFRDVPDDRMWSLVSAFPRHYSAIQGVIGGSPFEN